MYSGTTFHTKSGRVMGVHQKIDRVARRHVSRHLPPKVQFPGIKTILHFEGKNGPDGLKRKSPGVDEPWHFIDPHETENAQILQDIRNHVKNLTKALEEENTQRAGFEAAWLAHAVTDGLTPAHHVPYEAALAEIREGEHHTTRDTRYKKAIMPGKNSRDFIHNNWKYWGAKGLMNMHLQFEFGVATSMATLRFDTVSFDEKWQSVTTVEQLEERYLSTLATINALNMYDEFALTGWNTRLARETKSVLVPEIIRMVMSAWFVSSLGVKK